MGEMKDIRETARKILCNAMVAAVDPSGAIRTEGEREDVLRRLEHAVDAHMVMMDECLVQASLAGANSVHMALHQSPGVDREMLDEAVEYAPVDDDEEDGDGEA